MTQTRTRRCYEAGHRPKFLVVVDETDECSRAVYFAARRAKRTGARVTTLAVINPSEFDNWFNIGAVMREEAEGAAQGVLARSAGLVRETAGIEAEQIIREGPRAETVQALIDEDEDIALLVLAAGTGGEGPGPLVAMLAGKLAGHFPIPVVVVPGHLADDEIDALA